MTGVDIWQQPLSAFSPPFSSTQVIDLYDPTRFLSPCALAWYLTIGEISISTGVDKQCSLYHESRRQLDSRCVDGDAQRDFEMEERESCNRVRAVSRPDVALWGWWIFFAFTVVVVGICAVMAQSKAFQSTCCRWHLRRSSLESERICEPMTRLPLSVPMSNPLNDTNLIKSKTEEEELAYCESIL